MKNLILLVSLPFIFSCTKGNQLTKDFNCKTASVNNLEKVTDVKDLFSIEIPKNWKINLYQDEVQSSIFAADTTKQLTETVLLDVTFIQKKINFSEAFLLQQEQEKLSQKLIKVKKKEFLFLGKPSIYMVFKGKKGKFNYQICNTFIKVNESNFILAKAEIYGSLEVNKRLCNAFSLLENIKLNQ